MTSKARMTAIDSAIAQREEQVEQRYVALKAKVVERKNDFDNFINMLETKTSWLTAPASTRFHLNRPGGLLEHSVGVAENLLKFRDFLAPMITDCTFQENIVRLPAFVVHRAAV